MKYYFKEMVYGVSCTNLQFYTDLTINICPNIATVVPNDVLLFAKISPSILHI